MNYLESGLRRGEDGFLSVINNEYVSAALSVVLVVYAGMAAPQLPERVARLFENTLFRVLVFFLIAYTARKDASVAAIAAIGLMVSLQTLNRYNLNRALGGLVSGISSVVNYAGDEVVDVVDGTVDAVSGVFTGGSQHAPAHQEVVMEEESLLSMDTNCAGGACNVGQTHNIGDVQRADSASRYMVRNNQEDVGGFDSSATGFAAV